MSPGHLLIPNMPWEIAASQALSCSLSELRFLLCIFLSIPVSAGIRGIRQATLRRLYSVAVGSFLVVYCFGRSILQVAFPSAATYLAMLLAPRSCSYIAWATVFPYLVWLQVATASGMAQNSGAIDFVGGVMMLTLKLLSLAASRWVTLNPSAVVPPLCAFLHGRHTPTPQGRLPRPSSSRSAPSGRTGPTRRSRHRRPWMPTRPRTPSPERRDPLPSSRTSLRWATSWSGRS